MDETGVRRRSSSTRILIGSALLEREEVQRAQNPSASGDEDTASMELSTGPPVVGQRSSGKRGRGSRSEDSAGTEDADWRSRELDDFDGTGATEDGKRRKIAWTNTEDLVILTCVRRLGTQWPKIAVHLSGRTPDAVRNRWHRLQRTHSLSNTEEGNAALDQLLIVAGVLTPEEAASKPSQAPGSAAAAAAAAAGPSAAAPAPGSPAAAAAAAGPSTPLDAAPDEKCVRGSDHGRAMWKPEEDELIEEGVRRFGLKWRKVASALPGRTDSSVRNRWQRLQKEREERRKNPPPGKPPIPGASAPPPAGLAMPPRGRAAPPAGPLGHGSPLRGFDLELFCSTVEGVLEGVDEEGPPTTDAASPGAAAFEGLRMDESNPNTQMGLTALATVHTEVRPAPAPPPPPPPAPPAHSPSPSALPRSDRRPRLATDPSLSNLNSTSSRAHSRSEIGSPAPSAPTPRYPPCSIRVPWVVCPTPHPALPSPRYANRRDSKSPRSRRGAAFSSPCRRAPTPPPRTRRRSACPRASGCCRTCSPGSRSRRSAPRRSAWRGGSRRAGSVEVFNHIRMIVESSRAPSTAHTRRRITPPS